MIARQPGACDPRVSYCQRKTMRPVTAGGPARYQQIMQSIAEDISSGRVALGERLPTEPELCERYDAGRHTIREAVRGLVDIGMVERRPRVGTRVISAEPIAGYRWLPGSAADISANVSASRIVRPRSSVVTADEPTARRLGCTAGDRWFRFAGPRILRESAAAPVCFSEQYVPDTPRARRTITTGAFSVRDMAGQVVEQEIRADLLDSEQAEALDASPGSAALVVVRRHRDADGTLIAVGIHTHPADRFSITMTLPPEQPESRARG
jgi:GntR family transcriptional regulator